MEKNRAGARRSVRVDRPEQLRVLVAPVRQELLDWLGAGEDCTIAELARRMGRKRSSLYYHVHQLVKVGLVLERGRKRSGSRQEMVYGLASDRIQVASALQSPAAARALARSTAAILRRAQREFGAALLQEGEMEQRRGNALFAARMTARLPPQAVERVSRLVLDVQREFTNQKRAASGRWFAFTAVFVPLVDRSRKK